MQSILLGDMQAELLDVITHVYVDLPAAGPTLQALQDAFAQWDRLRAAPQSTPAHLALLSCAMAGGVANLVVNFLRKNQRKLDQQSLARLSALGNRFSRLLAIGGS
jgi:hypothetical protein